MTIHTVNWPRSAITALMRTLGCIRGNTGKAPVEMSVNGNGITASDGRRRVPMILGCAATVLLIAAFVFSSPQVLAQQFNSDNYVTMPKGVGTFLLTYGQRSSTILSVFALTNSFELNLGVNAVHNDPAENVSAYWSAVGYGHWKFYVNKSDTGGMSVTFGTGSKPGYLESGQITSSGRTYFVYFPSTIPFFKGKVSLDVDPGVLANLDYGKTKSTSWGFTHSTRASINKVFLKTDIVAEVYGTVGGAYAIPEYKAGLRWNPNDTFTLAATYGRVTNGRRGPGFEIGVMIFTPPFLCRGGCERKKQDASRNASSAGTRGK